MVKQIEDIYLCNSSGQILGVLNGIDEESCSLTVNVYGQYELSFNINEYIDSGNELVKANYYDEISMLMQLFIPSIGFFIINSSPTSKADSEVKSVAAISIDSELENKNTTFKINCGTKDSLEYIVTYEDDESETLINGYTGIPYDYITIYNNYDIMLTDVLKKYQSGYYSNYGVSEDVYAEHIDEIVELCNMIPRLKNNVLTAKDGTTSVVEYVIYTYNSDCTEVININLVQNLFESRLYELITFYQKYKSQLSLMDYIVSQTNGSWNIGYVDEKYHNKKVRFEIESSSIYSFLTQELPSAIEGICTFDILNKKINLISVENLGVDTGVIISYNTVQNQLDVQCDNNSIFTRFKVAGGENLNIKQVNYGTDIIEDLSYFMNYRDSNSKRLYVTDDLYNKYQKYLKYREDNREFFISYSDRINAINEEIKEITDRVPNDGLKTDWSTYTTKELEEQLNTYKKLLNTLITLYKNDYGANGCNTDGSVNEEYIKNTFYWYDYCAYKNIIQQIETTENNSLTDEEKEAKIDAYKTEWTLYGIVELGNIIKKYENEQSVYKKEDSIVFDVNGTPVPWDNLTDYQKSEYNDDLAGTYPLRYETYNELEKKKKDAKNYLDILNAKLYDLESQLSELDLAYNELKQKASLKNFSINGEKIFSEDDLKCIFNLYIDTDYSNENIITTSSDTVSSNLKHSQELLADAKERLSIESQPQYTFSISMDNILHVDGFDGIVNQFETGNFIYIEYKNDMYIKMRLVSYTYNPMIVDNELSVEFSNVIKSASKLNDFTYLLNNMSGSSKGSSSTSGGSGGSSSAFGDDLDVTMTNTMLAKLLNTELFGTRVSNVILDTIDVNRLNAKYATFGGLANGKTTIDGACVQTGKIVSNVNINNQPYTIINLDDGSFSFAGGKLYYSPTTNELVMSGTIKSTVMEGSIISGTEIIGGTIKIGDNFHVDNNGNMTCVNGNFTGYINTNKGYIGGFTITDTSIYTTDYSIKGCGLNIVGSGTAFWAGSGDYTGANAEFKVHHDGKVEASNLQITGGALNINNTFVVDPQGNVFSGQTTTSNILISQTSKYNTVSVNFANLGTAADDDYIMEGDYGQYLHLFIGETFGANIETSEGMVKSQFGEIRLRSRVRAYGSLIVGGGADINDSLIVGGSITTKSTKKVIEQTTYWVSLNASREIWSHTNIRAYNNIHLGGDIYSNYGSLAVIADDNYIKEKQSLGEKYEKFFMAINPCTFIYKGKQTRHIGAMGQQIEEALTESYLSNGAFAGLVKQEKCLVLHEEDDEYETLENVYRLKYEEFIMLNIHMTQKLYKRIEELETKITQLTEVQETSENNELDNELDTVENISFEGLE